MKASLDKITAKLQGVTAAVKRHNLTLFIVFFLGIYTFLVVRVNSLIQSEPGPEVTAEQVQTIQRLKLDKESIDKILELEEQNIEVRSLFKQARDNPFNE